jgi:hypothetical protein
MAHATKSSGTRALVGLGTPLFIQKRLKNLVAGGPSGTCETPLLAHSTVWRISPDDPWGMTLNKKDAGYLRMLVCRLFFNRCFDDNNFYTSFASVERENFPMSSDWLSFILV